MAWWWTSQEQSRKGNMWEEYYSNKMASCALSIKLSTGITASDNDYI